MTDKMFLSFWANFCPFTSTNNPNNQNFEEIKKITEDIIILHKCTKNLYHMLSCSWDMARDRRKFYFSFWAIFSFTQLKAQKKPYFKKWKKHLEISLFYISVPKIISICYNVPEIWPVTNVIFSFHFAPFFALLLPY